MRLESEHVLHFSRAAQIPNEFIARSPSSEQPAATGQASENTGKDDAVYARFRRGETRKGSADANSSARSLDAEQDNKGGSDSSEESSSALTEEEKKEVERLKERDREVRAHEQAHKAALGPYAAGGIQLQFTTGPDGGRYAVSGQVSVDMSSEDSPEKNLEKARTIRRAALAPAEPSGADRQVASAASRMEAEARKDMQEEQQEEQVQKSEGVKDSDSGTGPEQGAAIDRAAPEEQNSPSVEAVAPENSATNTADRSPTGTPSAATLEASERYRGFHINVYA